jgi:hypothetical protein
VSQTKGVAHFGRPSAAAPRCTFPPTFTLIRYDINERLRKLFDATHDDAIKDRAMALIGLETDPKYKKKYLTLWSKRSC